jgi:hypothetical protein
MWVDCHPAYLFYELGLCPGRKYTDSVDAETAFAGSSIERYEHGDADEFDGGAR